MPRFFIKEEQIKNNKIEIIGNDINHIKNVLRAKVGDTIEICNNETAQDYRCKILNINTDKIECEILESINSNSESNVKVSIFQGLPKADKMELIIQKSVELGVYDIIPVEMKRCVVKLNDKDKEKKVQRWQKISEVAAKQSGRNIVPKIKNPIKVQDICNLCGEYDILLVAYENEKNNTLKMELSQIEKVENEILNVGVVIGPEGGLEQEDVKKLQQHGAKIITLGNRILRTETVALNVLSIIMYQLEM